jgi:hypothetical protein
MEYHQALVSTTDHSNGHSDLNLSHQYFAPTKMDVQPRRHLTTSNRKEGRGKCPKNSRNLKAAIFQITGIGDAFIAMELLALQLALNTPRPPG